MPERENNRLVKRIDAYGGDILRSSRFRSTRKNIQHGTVSVYEHSISVAGCIFPSVSLPSMYGTPAFAAMSPSPVASMMIFARISENLT